MSQKRFWNYKDDDRTIDLSMWRQGLMDYGRYRGYEAAMDNTLVLKLGMDIFDPVISTDEEGKYSEVDGVKWLSVAITKQGVVVKETEVIEILVEANPAPDPRLDLIVMEHQYQFIVGGGSPAIYKVIKGTPAAYPIAPALTDPAKQVIIGRLRMGAGATNLLSGGTSYTKEPPPRAAGLMDLYSDQTSTGMKEFEEISLKMAVATLVNVPGSNTAQVILTGNKRNRYFVANLSTDNVAVNEMWGDRNNMPNTMFPQGYTVELIFKYPVLLTEGGNIFIGKEGFIGKGLFVNAYEPVQFINMRGMDGADPDIPSWYLQRTSKWETIQPTKYFKTQSGSAQGIVLDPGSGNQNVLEVTDGNIVILSTNTAGLGVKGIKIPPKFPAAGGTKLNHDPASTQGTVIMIHNLGNVAINFQPRSPLLDVNTGAKPIGDTFDLEPKATVILREAPSWWTVVDYYVREQSALDFRTDRPNRFTAMQHFNFQDLPTTVLDAGILKLPRTANAFRIKIDGNQQIATIADSDDNDLPAGTIIALQFIRADTPGSMASSRINLTPTGGGNPRVIKNYRSFAAAPQLNEQFDTVIDLNQTRGHTFLLVKENDGWNVVANSKILLGLSYIWQDVGANGSGTAAEFTVSWQNTGSGESTARLGKNLQDEVSIQGSVVATNTTTSTIFTLPVGYRPDRELYFATGGFIGGAPPTYQPRMVKVKANGEVQAIGTVGGVVPIAAGTVVYLDTIRFIATQ